VLITGATGALGPRVVEAFLAAGKPVRTLSLDEPVAGDFPDDVDAHIGDITDAKAVSAALEGIEHVIHLAALLHVVDPPPELEERYEHVNVGGTRTLLEEAVRSGVKRIVLFSTISVYGSDIRQRIINEDTTPQPVTAYARSKLEAERVVLSATNADDQPIGTILRMAAVYGPLVKGNYRRLVTALASGRFMPIGAGDNLRTLIYDRDAARAAVLAAYHPAAGGQVFNVSDGEFHSLHEIIDAMCKALGRKPPRISIPTGLARPAAGMLEGIARVIGRRSPISRATVDKYTEDIAVDSRRIRTTLEFRPEYSLKRGWEEAIREMRRRGDL
jgi:UDP-glucose 4-epimerase